MRQMRTFVAIGLGLAHLSRALPQAASTTATAPSGVSTGVPSLTLSTAIASASAPSSPLPSQLPLPPKQAWCPSDIFCAGELLQSVDLAELFADPKTFVDKPTNRPSQQVLSNFDAISNASTTEGTIQTFVDTNFKGEGLELEAVALTSFNPEPAVLNNVTDPLLKGWVATVNSYWTQLIRDTNDTALCQNGECESTLIPLNHTFVVPGGRFREQYYWDSYWIVQGLIKSELFDIINGTLQNFMDELEHIGFIPNGGRIYYLNRSQPPLFIRMLGDYVAASNDTLILRRALPLAEKELAWWAANRTLSVTSPFTNRSYELARYAVTNTAPRPESYLQDYLTATDPNLPALNEDQRASLYAELASGAESGWDFTARFASQPRAGSGIDQNPLLRSYNIISTIPVDLNAILYNAHTTLAGLYRSQGNREQATNHTQAANTLRAGILDLFWDPTKLAFYDFNLTSNSRNSIYTPATFYPLWAGIVPDELVASSQNAFGFFSSLNMVLNRYNGTFPSTFLETGLQWDAPNAWPPHQYIAVKALEALPANVTAGALPTPASNQSTFNLIPAGQLGLEESELPGQPLIGGGNATTSGPQADINRLNGTVVNGGNATDGEGWAFALRRQLANRYFASAFCSWHATGGSIPGLLPRLSDQELNITQSVNNTGNMFEKFSISDIDSAGRGGEYTVQAGFGWTNGVVLSFAGEYGQVLVAPACPNITEEAGAGLATTGGGSSGGSSGAASILSLPSVSAVVAICVSMAVWFV